MRISDAGRKSELQRIVVRRRRPAIVDGHYRRRPDLEARHPSPLARHRARFFDSVDDT